MVSLGPHTDEACKQSQVPVDSLRMGAKTNIFSLEDSPLGYFVTVMESLTNTVCVVCSEQCGVIIYMSL